MSRDGLDGSATEPLVQPGTAPRRLRLVVATGPDRGRSFLLTPGKHRLGKSRSCDFQLTDGAVSGQHLEVEAAAAGVTLRDLGSTNGSWFAGARFTVLEVDRAATVTIGKSELRIEVIDVTAMLAPSSRTSFGGLLGSSEPMRRLFTLLERVAATDSSVLIEGETGTGKELVARALHDASPRRAGPFVVCDLAAITAALCESELFGHVKGAFTGADRDRTGAFAAAHGGTIFLDELGELPLEVQPRLLRALEGRAIRPVGGAGYRAIDVRVVAATNRDLPSEIKAGAFREDLYHRLSVVTARLPALRERTGDVPILVEHFLGPSPRRPDAATMAALAHHAWPGNVRELRNVVERARALDVDLTVALVGGAVIGTDPTPAAAPIDGRPFREAKEQLIDAWERDYVVTLLARCQGNVSLAARHAGMDRAYLHRLLKKHALA